MINIGKKKWWECDSSVCLPRYATDPNVCLFYANESGIPSESYHNKKWYYNLLMDYFIS